MTKKLKPNLTEYLDSALFRANQDYELVMFDRLSPDEQELFSDLRKQPKFYGILRPRESSKLSIKSISQDTALLYLSLREPGKLPAYARTIGGQDFAQAVAKFVIDQVLEIEKNGEFVSGANAYQLFYVTSAHKEPTTRVEELSIEALRYGQALKATDINDLSMRLYHYNCIPISSRWKQRFAGPEEVADLLGVGPTGQDHRNKHWRETPPSEKRKQPTTGNDDVDSPNFVSWLSWTSRKGEAQTAKNNLTFKLYLSPLPEFIPEVFRIAFSSLSKTNAFHLKVGADAQGLLRPDKMVAYFHSQDDLRMAAELLAQGLEGCPVHGVPFTADIAGDGLLSWGVDPPDGKQLLSWQPQESWRLWLTNRLANALVTGHNPVANSSSELEPWEYAMERLSLEGVDTRFWTPAQKIWN